MVNNWYYLFKHLVVVFMVMLILLVLEIKRGNHCIIAIIISISMSIRLSILVLSKTITSSQETIFLIKNCLD